MKKTNKTPGEYLKAPYTRVLIPDQETDTYTAEILEFPGCISQGDTAEEALKYLEDAAEGWIQACLDLGQKIPEPLVTQGDGGMIALRLPRNIHRQAARMAECEGVSLNQFLLSAIAARVGAEDLIDPLKYEADLIL